MRLLTRLALAGAAAVTAWLLTGVVTVRALDDPTRIGLLPGVHVPLIAFAVLLALSGAVRHPGAAIGPVTLACLATLPWWPIPVPSAALLLAGPLGWVWFAGCLACAIVLPTGGWRWWRVRRLVSDPVRAPALAALLAGMLLLASAIHMAPRHPDGDEPDYLIIAQSLLYDGDLQIENNHQRFDYEAYHGGVLPPSYLQRGRNGQIYPVHAPGLPVLLLPAFAAAGHAGAVATVILLCMAGVALLWRLAFQLTESAAAAWFGTASAVGAAPFFLHAFVIFPDAPAGALALVAIWAMVEPQRFQGWRMALPSLALVWLPWMHTRFVIIAAGLGAGVLVTAMRQQTRTRADLCWFVAPAALGAMAWFGFFWFVYGVPNPSAPYGAYTQTAWRHIPPGLAGLLVDQQFGLFATAPVLLVALAAVRRPWRRRVVDGLDTRAFVVLSVLAGTGLVYLLLTASYRMWWGGLSAPARFLAPLVLPAGVVAALAWQTLRTQSSRHVAVGLLVASVVLTALMVVVDHGRLAYNARDGYARWAEWASPLVDLPGALPAAHRDGPGRVVRDAAVWFGALGAAWLVLRLVERHRPLTAAFSLGTLGLASAVAASAVWAVRGQQPLHPVRSQVRWLLHDAAERDMRPLVLTPPPEDRRRGWFDLDLMTSAARPLDEFTALQLDDLPAGRYRVVAVGAEAGTTFGVAVGKARPSSFIAEVTTRSGRAATEFVLPVAVDRLVVRSSQRVRGSGARVWLRAEEVRAPSGRHERLLATRAERRGAVAVHFPTDSVYPEPDGFWLAGDSATFVGFAGTPGTRVSLRATAGARTVSMRVDTGPRTVEERLEAGASTPIDIGRLPGSGGQVVRFSVDGAFRPALVDGASDDARRLGVWVTLDQNLTTPLR